MHEGIAVHRVGVDRAAIGFDHHGVERRRCRAVVVDHLLPMRQRHRLGDVARLLVFLHRGIGRLWRHVRNLPGWRFQQQGVDPVVGIALQRDVELHAGRGQQRCQLLQCLRLGAVVYAAHQQPMLPVRLQRDHGHVAESRRGTGAHIALLHRDQRGRRVGQAPAQSETPDLPKGLQAISGLQQHAEVVAGAATDAPEQIGVVAGVGLDDAAVHQHHQHRLHVVAVHAELARGEPIAAALHIATDADIGAAATRHMQVIGIERGVELLERGAWPDAGGVGRGIDAHVAQAAGVENNAVIHRVAGGAVATRTTGHLQAEVGGQGEDLLHIAEGFAVGDEQRIGLERGVGFLAVLVVAGLAGKYHLALEPVHQAGQAGAVQAQAGKGAAGHLAQARPGRLLGQSPD